jgi:hypothetical protein
MITLEQWKALEPIRTIIEEEYVRTILSQPERLQAYRESVEMLKKPLLNDFGLDLSDIDTVFAFAAGLSSALSFTHQYCSMVCPDKHALSHLSEAAVYLGYLVRELCFIESVPWVVPS